MVAVGSGLVAASFGPFLIAAAVPDSITPFLVFGLAAGRPSSAIDRSGWLRHSAGR
jgi:hypothetical protein